MALSSDMLSNVKKEIIRIILSILQTNDFLKINLSN